MQQHFPTNHPQSMKPIRFFMIVASSLALACSIATAQTRRADDSTGVQPLLGKPTLPADFIPPSATAANGTIPFSYTFYGAIMNSSDAGVASYWMSGSSVIVAVVGASGQAVNQSPPQLQDTAGQIYWPVSSNCGPGAPTCTSTYTLVSGRSPMRLYVYVQTNFMNN